MGHWPITIRGMTFKLKFLLYVPIGLVFLVICVSGLAQLSHSYQLSNCSYEDVSQEFVVRVSIPPQAKNITVWVQPSRMNITAAFAINEQEFLAWGQQQGWKLAPIRNQEVRNLSSEGNPNGSVTIVDGWLFDEQRLDSTCRRSAYDRTTKTGYFTQLGD